MHRLARLVVAALASVLPGAPAANAAPPCGSVVVPSGLGMSPLPGAVSTLQPILLTGSLYEGQLSLLMYLPLLWYSGTNRIDWSRSLASAITANADDTVFTIRLRDWNWSDGVPITSADVLYAWTEIRRLGSAFSSYGIGDVPQGIESVTAPDAHTVVISLKHRVNPDWFTALGIGQFTPIPAHRWTRYTIAEQQTLQSTASFYDVVDGPYRLVSLRLGRDAVFVPNPIYRGHPSSVARLVVDFLPGADPLQALQAHQVDAANVPPMLLKAIWRLPNFHLVRIGPTETYNAIIPNVANPLKPFLADVRFRQAMARAIDQLQIISTVFGGVGSPQHGPLSQDEQAFLPPDMRKAPSPMSYDPAAARRLLDEMGYRPGPDGIRVRNGVRLSMTLLESAGNDEGLLIDQLVAADLRKVGIEYDIKQLEFNQLYAKALGPPVGWDAVGFGFSGGAYPDGSQMFLSTSGENLGHYKDATMDRLVDAASTEAGPQAIWAMERYIVEQQPLIFLAANQPSLLVRPGLDNILGMTRPNAMWTPDELRLSGPMSCDAPHA